MPFSSQLQARLDAAQKQLDDAKAAHNANVKSYNDLAATLTPLYKDAVPDASAASTWFNAFSKGPCKDFIKYRKPCHDTVDQLNAIIPQLKASYAQVGSAQANYDKVFAEVTAAAQADPQLQLQQQQIEANAGANKLKWVFWIAVVVVVAVSAFVYFKFIKKAI